MRPWYPYWQWPNDADACFASLQMRRIRHLVPTATFQILVAALVHSRLDHKNSLLVGLPAYLLCQLQSVLNSAAHLVYHLTARDHITDALISLHWLRAPERILYKMAVLTYNALHEGSPVTTLPQFVGPRRRPVWSTSTPLCRIEPFSDSAVQTADRLTDWLTNWLSN